MNIIKSWPDALRPEVYLDFEEFASHQHTSLAPRTNAALAGSHLNERATLVQVHGSQSNVPKIYTKKYYPLHLRYIYLN